MEDIFVPAFVVLTASMMQIPIVIAFTIKHQNKTSKMNPIVPSTLQFHGEDPDFEESNEEINGDTEMLASETLVKNLACPKTPQFDCDDDHNIDQTLEQIVAYNSVDNKEESGKLPGQVCHM